MGGTSSSDESAPDAGRPWWRSVFGWLGRFGISFGLYFCFAVKLGWREAVIGVGAAALAATASQTVRRAQTTRFPGHGRCVVQAYRLPKYAVRETWTVLAALFRHVFMRRKAGSILLEVPFAADDATRRALAAAYTTMTPSTVVLGFDEERSRMIVHQIERSALSEMTRRLGARP